MPPDATVWDVIQPRYAAYCLAHGAASPQEMLERDAAAYPGGKMAGFTIWIGQKMGEYRKLHRYGVNYRFSSAEHDVFDGWLLKSVTSTPNDEAGIKPASQPSTPYDE